MSTQSEMCLERDPVDLNAERIEQEAKCLATKKNPYSFYFREVTFHYSNGVLTLRGRLPSFYMKQILQTALQSLEGVERIDNQVNVVSTTGLSSVREEF